MSPEVTPVYLSLHGAMGAIGELDPEGYLLEHVRASVGAGHSDRRLLDLHGLLTDRMLSNCDAIAVYHTYPHNDFTSTGQRAAGSWKPFSTGAPGRSWRGSSSRRWCAVPS